MAKPPFINDPVGSIQRELNRRGLPSPTPFIPNTRTRTSHALTIRDGATGQLIGAIYTFAPKQARTLEEEYEINRDTRGLPVDIVPQNLTTRTLQIARYDLFTKIMEDVFGHKEMVILTDQKRPFRIRETWRDPAAILGGGRRIYEYTGCWFQDLGRTLSATDDRIVKVDATLMFRDRQRFILMTTTKHALLEKIEQELAGVRIARPVTVAGHSYGLTVLDNADESLVKAIMPENVSMWQALSDTTTQTLAVALRSIDDTPIEILFKVTDDLPPDERSEAVTNERKWRCKQLTAWLAGKPGPFVRTLWNHYLELQSEASKSLEEIKSF